ncbi:hypothetical protein TVAG_415130 [Trichomonas vaginalis G3]|uniref:Uncharacterized protein n=1 Tax=Trichomonas vaginalis (strain ATCC PRA-98 / G3) TaxID=412133 RepID=A2FAJ6_TRIV3|nr:hypothetical protein TVAGG3_0479980 [Trichomonas vaginalis G3]EAX98089.1 hypothetical protein TVAG_415130 [Trichomonas vaginalis G3]KAI5515630.1 hypothetical protein TVAGG3_0479980 [Trichomonas vaginalis G3]|eukprot:XP_001311019.1 hypothetical protein [Trichomonas vaginalis G3]
MRYADKVNTGVLYFDEAEGKRAIFSNCYIASNKGRLIKSRANNFQCMMDHCYLYNNSDANSWSEFFSNSSISYSNFTLDIRVECISIKPFYEQPPTPLVRRCVQFLKFSKLRSIMIAISKSIKN